MRFGAARKPKAPPLVSLTTASSGGVSGGVAPSSEARLASHAEQFPLIVTPVALPWFEQAMVVIVIGIVMVMVMVIVIEMAIVTVIVIIIVMIIVMIILMIIVMLLTLVAGTVTVKVVVMDHRPNHDE